MPREHARLLTRIWQDADFRALEAGQQRAYMLLLSQPGINWAGVLSLTPRRWASLAADTNVAGIEHDLKVLEHTRFVVVDEDTEELLIRSFLRNDGVYLQPNVLASAVKSAREVQSPRLRAALAEELRRIVLPEPKSAKAKLPDLVALADELAPNGPPEPPPEGFAEPFENPSANPEPGESENRRQKPLTEGFDEGLQEPLTEPPGDGEGVPLGTEGSTSADGCASTRTRARTRARSGNPANISLNELAETAHVPQARRIVTDWCQRHGVNYPTRTLRALGKEVDRLLTDRGDPDVIATALDLWHQRADAGTGLLPHLYVDALKTHHGASSGRSTRDDKIQGWRALAENPDAVLPATDRDDKINGWLRLVDEIDDERPDLRAVEGGRTA